MQDFGSAREARVAVQNRAQALAQQEDAAVHCSAPYRHSVPLLSRSRTIAAIYQLPAQS